MTIQSIAGTGALRVGAQMIYKFWDKKPTIYFSEQTWPNHDTIFLDAGLTEHKRYPYYDVATRKLKFEGMIETMREAEPGSVFVLQAICHNPTGVDPTKEQWQEIINVMKEKEHFPYIDFTYNGWATGNFEQDAYVVRMFAAANLQHVVGQSFSKNAGMYGERIGGLHFFCASPEAAQKVYQNTRYGKNNGLTECDLE